MAAPPLQQFSLDITNTAVHMTHAAESLAALAAAPPPPLGPPQWAIDMENRIIGRTTAMENRINERMTAMENRINHSLAWQSYISAIHHHNAEVEAREL